MVKKMKLTRVALACLMAISTLDLTGCAAYLKANSAVNDTTARIDTDNTHMQDAKTPVVSVSGDSWLLGDTVAVEQNESPVLQTHVAYSPAGAVTLADVASYITANYGIQIDISDLTGNNGLSAADDQSRPADSNGSAAPINPAAIPRVAMPASTLPLPPGFLTNATAARASLQGLPKMRIQYDGKLGGLLDVVDQNEGIWSRIDNGRVVFFRTETKTIYMPAVKRHSNVKASIVASGAPTTGVTVGQAGSTSSGSGGSDGSAGQTTITTDYDVDFWKELEKTAQTIAPRAHVHASPALSSITVTGTPTEVHHVEEWAKGVSEHKSQMVSVMVRMLTVTLNREDSMSWNPNILFNKLGSANGWSLAGPGAPSIASGVTPFSLGFKVLTGSSSSLAGSQAMLNLLSTMGNISGDKIWSTVVLDGETSPVQQATQVTYAVESGATATANVGTTSTIEQGVVTTGLTGSLTPEIVNGKITLSMDVTDSVLQALSTFTSNGAQVQQPKIGITQLPSSIALKPGETLLATGITDTQGTVNNNGVFVPFNPVLGGGFDGNWTKTMVVVEITAEVM